MRKSKLWLALALAVALVVGCSTVAWAADDASLSDLSLSYKGQEILFGTYDKDEYLGFSSSRTNYTLDVESDVLSLDVAWETTDPDATVAVYLGSREEGSGDHIGAVNVGLYKGIQLITVQVTAPDGTKQRYSLNVSCGPVVEEKVKGLTLRYLDNNDQLHDLELTPTFAYDTSRYSAYIDQDLRTVILDFTAKDDTATVAVYLDNTLYRTIASDGQVYLNLDPDEERFTVKLVVTPGDGSKYKESTYTVNIRRGNAPPPVITTTTTLKLTLDSTTASVNEQTVVLDAAPLLYNYQGINYAMVPIRFIGEQGLDAKVTWKGETQTVTITKGEHELTLTLGQVAAGMSCPPVAQNGRIFVPIRYVAETLGANVQYSGANVPIVITITESK